MFNRRAVILVFVIIVILTILGLELSSILSNVPVPTPTEAPAVSPTQTPVQTKASIFLNVEYSNDVPQSWILNPKTRSVTVSFTKQGDQWNRQPIPELIKNYGPLFSQTLSDSIKFKGDCPINTYYHTDEGLPIAELWPLNGCYFPSESIGKIVINVAQCALIENELFCEINKAPYSLEYQYNLSTSTFTFIFHSEYFAKYQAWITQSLIGLGFNKSEIDKQYPITNHVPGESYSISK